MEKTPIAVLEYTIKNFSQIGSGHFGAEEKVKLMGTLEFRLQYSKSSADGVGVFLRLRCLPKNSVGGNDAEWGPYDVEFDVHVMKADGQSKSASWKQRFSQGNNGWGCQSVVDLETLLNPSSKYVVNNQLKIAAKIYSISYTSNGRSEELKAAVMPVTPPSLLLTFLESAVGADVSFIANDGGEVKAHSGILMAASPALKAMLEAPMQESITRKVKLEDMTTVDSVQTFLKCIYTGSLSHLEGVGVELSVLKEVINAAEKYKLDALKTGAGSLLVNHVCPRNAVHLLNFAKRYGLQETEKKVREYAKANVDAVLDNTPEPDME